MAAKKKVETEEETKEVDLDDLIESEFAEMQDLSKIDDSVNYWVDTGNWALNYCISKRFRGGYPGGRISNLYGLSGTGKSMMPVIATKSKQWNNINFYNFDRIIVVDSEGGGTGKSLFEFVDAPLERVRYITIKCLECYRTNKKTGKSEAIPDKDLPKKMETDEYVYTRGLIQFLKGIVNKMVYTNSKIKLCIIVDSISNIGSFRKQVEGVEDVGKTNKLLNNLFALDTDLHNIDATVLLASKVYTNIGNEYDPWKVSGGQAIMYNPSLSVELTAMASSDDQSETDVKAEKERRKTALGSSVKPIRAVVKKSRFGTENRTCTFMLDATYGIIKMSGLFKLLKDFGVIKQSGSRYTIPGVIINENNEDISFFKKDFAKLFMQNESEYIDKLQPIMERREKEIKEERMKLVVSDMSELPQEDENELVETSEAEVSLADMVSAMEAEDEA